MMDFKGVIGMWLLAQIFIVPYIIIDDEMFGLIADFGTLALLIVIYLGLKLIGV